MAGQPTPRKKTILDEYKMRLMGTKEGPMTREPSLVPQVSKNQVHFNVYTNIPNEKDNGRIVAAMDAYTFFTFMHKLNLIIEGKSTVGFETGCYGHSFFQGQRSEKKLLTKILVNFDDDGRLYVAVVAKDHYNVKFHFSPADYHHFKNIDGSDINPRELSLQCAGGWFNMMTLLTAEVLNDNYVEPPPYNPAGGKPAGNGNWGNRTQGGGNNWGGGNQPQQPQQQQQNWGGDSGFPDNF